MDTSDNKNPLQQGDNIPPQTPSASPQTNGNGESGSQYETDILAPEDLDSRWTRWQCGVCNYTYEGSKPLKKCPKCGNEDEEKFLDVD